MEEKYNTKHYLIIEFLEEKCEYLFFNKTKLKKFCYFNDSEELKKIHFIFPINFQSTKGTLSVPPWIENKKEILKEIRIER